MAKEEKSQAGISAPVGASKLPAGFKSIVMNEPAYNVDATTAAQGYLVEHVRMPDAKGEDGLFKAWHALRFVATAPVECSTRDGEVVIVPVGGRFYIGDSKALQRDDLIAAALHPEVVREVYVKCISKTKIQGTVKTFRNFEIALTDVNHSRSIPALANIARPLALPAAAPMRQLPAQNGGALAGAGAVALSDN